MKIVFFFIVILPRELCQKSLLEREKKHFVVDLFIMIDEATHSDSFQSLFSQSIS